MQRLQRVILFGLLGLFAAFFLLPFYVMLVTSLKDMEEIRNGSLLSLPGLLRPDAWSKAWGSACTGMSRSGPPGRNRTSGSARREGPPAGCRRLRPGWCGSAAGSELP